MLNFRRKSKAWISILLSFMAPAYSHASVSVNVNGSSYTIPQKNEKGWGDNVTSWIQAISANTLQPVGGSFTLSSDIDFGSSFGLKSLYYKTRSSNIASAGNFRLANTDSISWRNSGNSSDLSLIPKASTDGVLQYNSVDLVGTSLTQTLTNKTLTSPVISQIINTGTLTLPTASDTLVGRATTDTLTNKSLVDNSTSIVDNSDNTKQIKFDAAGTTGTGTTVTSSQTSNRVWTLPDATDTSVGKATTDTLTNKTISGSSNTLSNIGDGSLSTSYVKSDGSRALSSNWNAGSFSGTFNSVQIGSAANQVSGLSTIINTGTLTLPTASDTLVGRATTDTLTNKTLSFSSNTFTGQLGISNGGTGQASKAAAFDALSPSTTKGDLIGFSTTGVRVAVGSDGQVLTADSASTPGIKWASAAAAPSQSYELSNIGFATSVAASAMTVALKQSDGSSDCSAGAPCKLGFRSSTVTSGAYNQRSVTASLSVVISSGATLGQANAGTQYIWVYALDNAGTVELAVSSTLYDDWSVQSTTTMSGSSTSGTTIYSTTGRSNVPIRVLGRIKNSQTAAGTYAANSLENSLSATKRQSNLPTIQKFTSGSSTYTTAVGATWIRVRLIGAGGGGGGSGTSGAPGGNGGTGGNTTFGSSLLAANGGQGGQVSGGGGSGGTGGSASLGTGPIGLALTGGNGTGANFQSGATNNLAGGAGGASAFGGTGGGLAGAGGGAGVTNTGGGGAGGGTGGTGNTQGGPGGGSGGFVDAIIQNPSATYSYAVGAAGTAGTAGTSGFTGGAGGSGLVVVEEYYQ